MDEVISSFRDVLILLLGAGITFLAGYFVWRRQAKEERRKRREENLMKAIQLSFASLTYARSIMYAKADELKTIINLPDNPVDQVMSIILVHFPEAWPKVQELHLQQQELYKQPVDVPNATGILIAICEGMAGTTTQLVTCLRDIAVKEGFRK